MSSYYATYKCPLCGEVIYHGHPTEVPDEKLVELIGKVISNQIMQGNPYLYQAPMYMACKCKDGNAGLAVFSGFTREDYRTGAK